MDKEKYLRIVGISSFPPIPKEYYKIKTVIEHNETVHSVKLCEMFGTKKNDAHQKSPIQKYKHENEP